jgi:hypothetical protein
MHQMDQVRTDQVPLITDWALTGRRLGNGLIKALTRHDRATGNGSSNEVRTGLTANPGRSETQRNGNDWVRIKHDRVRISTDQTARRSSTTGMTGRISTD